VVGRFFLISTDPWLDSVAQRRAEIGAIRRGQGSPSTKVAVKVERC